MTTPAHRLLRFELTVGDLARAERFYVEGLGFTLECRTTAKAAMAHLLGAERIAQSVLRRGEQTLVLQLFAAPGAPYPADAGAADQRFQHLALPVPRMEDALGPLSVFAPATISIGGPQRLPPSSGGVVAFKFRDPDGHPLELIEFPDRHGTGIDHSAITVMDAGRSIAFYRDQLGLRVAARQVNVGPEQDRLDGVQGAEVDVVSLTPAEATPHVELLAYRSPPVRPAALLQPHDIAATRLVLAVRGALPDGARASLIHDPDGHALLLTADG